MYLRLGLLLSPNTLVYKHFKKTMFGTSGMGNIM